MIAMKMMSSDEVMIPILLRAWTTTMRFLNESRIFVDINA